MTDEERFQFDLQGFLIVKGVLSATELRVLNAAVDERFDEYAQPSEHWAAASLQPLGGSRSST